MFDRLHYLSDLVVITCTTKHLNLTTMLLKYIKYISWIIKMIIKILTALTGLLACNTLSSVPDLPYADADCSFPRVSERLLHSVIAVHAYPELF